MVPIEENLSPVWIKTERTFDNALVPKQEKPEDASVQNHTAPKNRDSRAENKENLKFPAKNGEEREVAIRVSFIHDVSLSDRDMPIAEKSPILGDIDTKEGLHA